MNCRAGVKCPESLWLVLLMCMAGCLLLYYSIIILANSQTLAKTEKFS